MTEDQEFSHTVAVSDIPESGLDMAFEASGSERAVLARRLGLEALEAFNAHAKLTRWRGDGVKLDACFKASVIQLCVVTLEPVAETIEQRFIRRYLPAERLERETGRRSGSEVIVDAELEEDEPEPLPGARIDVGDAVAEELALAVDPYPRKAGVVFETPPEGSDSGAQSRENPFVALKKLKNQS